MAVLNRVSRLRSRIPMPAMEILLFLAIAVAVDTWFLDGTRFTSWRHHPFWAIVLLTTVQYGTNVGLACTIAATAVMLAGNVPPQPVSQDLYTWLADVTRLPLLWFLASVVLGELRVRQMNQHRGVSKALAESEAREKGLTEAYGRLNSLRQTLEARVAGQLKTAVNIHDAARAIEKLDPDDVLLGVPTLMRAVINPQRFSLFILVNGCLELRLSEGAEDGVEQRRSFDAHSDLFREIVGSRRFLCRTIRGDEAVLRDHGVLAGPLLTADGQAIGMLKIESLGFLDLNFSNVQTFRAACEWIGTAYANAQRYQLAKSEAMVSSESDLLSYSFLGRQTALFTSLARRIGFNVSMLILDVSNYDVLPEPTRRELGSRVSRCVTKSLRTTDLAFDYKRSGAEYAIVLPGTGAHQVPVALQKLNDALMREFDGDPDEPVFTHRIQVLHEVPVARESAAAGACS